MLKFCCGLFDIRSGLYAAGIIMCGQFLIFVIGIAVSVTRDPRRKPDPLLIYSICQWCCLPATINSLVFFCRQSYEIADGLKMTFMFYLAVQTLELLAFGIILSLAGYTGFLAGVIPYFMLVVLYFGAIRKYNHTDYELWLN